jgi:acyl-CoA synthetase (AMP-forming)/AMP-acid ligase II
VDVAHTAIPIGISLTLTTPFICSDERFGEIVAVVIDIIPGKQLTEKEVLEYCENLPRYKRPRRVFFGEVPRNPTGKIEKPKLRKRYTGVAEAFKI